MASHPDQVSSGGAAVNCAVEQRRIGAACVVSVAGTVDMLTAPQLQTAIAVAAEGAPPALVVDLTDVEFLASAGMSVLVAAQADLVPAVRFAVVADGPSTSRPLKLVGIADLIDMFATLDEALAAVGA